MAGAGQSGRKRKAPAAGPGANLNQCIPSITRGGRKCKIVEVIIKPDFESDKLNGKGVHTIASCETSAALAETTVKALIQLSGNSGKMRSRALAAYMEGFTDMALKAAGKPVMDEVMDLLQEEE